MQAEPASTEVVDIKGAVFALGEAGVAKRLHIWHDERIRALVSTIHPHNIRDLDAGTQREKLISNLTDLLGAVEPGEDCQLGDQRPPEAGLRTFSGFHQCTVVLALIEMVLCEGLMPILQC